MASGNNARIVQQELGREHFATVSRERVLGEKIAAVSLEVPRRESWAARLPRTLLLQIP